MAVPENDPSKLLALPDGGCDPIMINQTNGVNLTTFHKDPKGCKDFTSLDQL